jgi:hypothetical protein
MVVVHEGAWKISLNGRRYGPYPSKRAAVQAAVYAAYRTGQTGHFAEVLVQEKNHEVRKEWTFGDDAYPLPSSGRRARPRTRV